MRDSRRSERRNGFAVLKCFTLTGIAAMPLLAASAFAEQITVEITDKPVVKNVRRIGTNVPWHFDALKKRHVAINFEGAMARWCNRGELFSDGLMTYEGPNYLKNDENSKTQLQKVKAAFVGMDIIILSGPAKQQKRKIVDIGFRTHTRFGSGPEKKQVLIFDKPVDLPPELAMSYKDAKERPFKGSVMDDPILWCGAVIENLDTSAGNFAEECGGGRWMCPEAQREIVKGDVPPGSEGVMVGKVKADDKPVQLMMSLVPPERSPDQNSGVLLKGLWLVRFWAKNVSGSPMVKVEFPKVGMVKVPITDTNWKKYEVPIEVKNDDFVGTAYMNFSGGTLLVDDITVDPTYHKNPTAFRDEIVNSLKRLSPGTLRMCVCAGDTVENWVKPQILAHPYVGDPSQATGVASPYLRAHYRPVHAHEFLELCEYLGADSWYSLVGAIHVEEMDQLMEYLGAPANVGLGKLRAKLGHPKPWTESLRQINIEFGNEVWNWSGFIYSSFDRADYWNDLIARAKKSPYYKPNIVFQADGQSHSDSLAKSILKHAPNFDSYGTAPYILHGFPKEVDTTFDTDEKLFKWVFGVSQNDVNVRFKPLAAFLKEKNIEPSFYEFSYHITGGKGSVEKRNKITMGIAGGVNLMNTSLSYLKQYGVRIQNNYSYMGRDMGTPMGTVKLWGIAYSVVPGYERYHAFYYAMMMANRMLSGDMVETVHTGGQPMFTTPAMNQSNGEVRGEWTYPTVYSYALSDGKKRGLILISLETKDAHQVTLKFPGAVKGGKAMHCLLTADKMTASEELGPRELKYSEAQEDFKSGQTVAMPPYSMHAWTWETE